MAKQSVSFAERHLEKIVVGVAGLITLTMAALYVVRSPNTVDAGGTTVGPTDMGTRLKEETRQAYKNIGDSKPKRTPLPDYVAQIEQSRPSQIDRALAPMLAVAPTPLNPLPPPVNRIDITGKARLAKILPPGKPVIFQGRNRATLAAATELVTISEGGDMRTAAAAPEASSVRDTTWVTVAAPVFRSKQLDEFSAAGYVPPRNQLLITGVRLERQRLLPDGTWSEPPDEVQTYTKYSPITPPELKLAQDETGWGIEADSGKRLETLINAVNKDKETQATIWRPPLAPFLDLKSWPPPDAPKIEEVTWDEWLDRDTPGSQFKGPTLSVTVAPMETPKPERKTKKDTTKTEQSTKSKTPPPSGRSTPSETKPPPPKKTAEASDERAKAITAAQKNLKDAQTAFDEKDLQTAARLLDEILRDEAKVPKNLIDKANTLKGQVDDNQKTVDEKAAKKKEEKDAREKGQLQVDVEPLWAHDLTAQPGRTYRYRVRIEALNQYAGFPRDLADPHDAEKVIVGGDWSEWSDPVVVRPDTYVFLVGASKDTDGGVATVDLWKWTAGEWKTLSKKKFEIGQQISCDDRKAGRVDAQLTVVDIEVGATRAVRSNARKDGSFTIEPANGLQVVLLADADGQVWERNTQEDRNSPDLQELKAELKKESGKDNQPRVAPKEPKARPAPEPPAGRSVRGGL